VGDQRLDRATLPEGTRPGTYCTGGWVGPTAGLDACGNLVTSGIQSADRPTCNELLYRPTIIIIIIITIIIVIVIVIIIIFIQIPYLTAP